MIEYGDHKYVMVIKIDHPIETETYSVPYQHPYICLMNMIFDILITFSSLSVYKP